MYDKSVIEEKAISLLKLELLKTGCIYPNIVTNDKTPSWDGELFLYERGCIFSKESFKGRISVQVKGTFAQNLVKKEKFKFSVDLLDIKNYFSDKRPICYYVVQLSDNEVFFYYKIWRTNDLKSLIKKCGDKKSITIEFDRMKTVEEFLDDFTASLEDNQKEIYVLSSDEGEIFKCDKSIIPDYWNDFYIYGLENVKVSAFIPVVYNKELSCLISINGHDSIAYGQKDLENIFFSEYNKPISERKFILYHNGIFVFQVPHLRFTISEKTTFELCKLLDDLYDEYIKRKNKIKEVLGSHNFTEVNGEIKILSIPKYIWYKMLKFTYEHDYMDTSDTVWNIFYPCNGYKIIQIYNNINSGIKADLLARLYTKTVDVESIDIYWEPGFTPYIGIMDGFDDRVKWTAEYTHDWIIDNWVPYLIFLSEEDNKSIFWWKNNKRPFIEFKKTFNSKEYGIRSYKD